MNKEIGIDSNVHLAFHIPKLAGLIGTDPEGKYQLIDSRRGLGVTLIAGEAFKMPKHKGATTKYVYMSFKDIVLMPKYKGATESPRSLS